MATTKQNTGDKKGPLKRGPGRPRKGKELTMAGSNNKATKKKASRNSSTNKREEAVPVVPDPVISQQHLSLNSTSGLIELVGAYTDKDGTIKGLFEVQEPQNTSFQCELVVLANVVGFEVSFYEANDNDNEE